MRLLGRTWSSTEDQPDFRSRQHSTWNLAGSADDLEKSDYESDSCVFIWNLSGSCHRWYCCFWYYFGTYAERLAGTCPVKHASIIVFTFWGTAEMSDLVRGALISIPKHQYESSEALGLSKVQTYWYIIIPQTLRRLIPLSINLITRMIKTTSLILMIGVVEVLKVAQQIIEANRMSQSKCCIWHLSGSIFIILFWHAGQSVCWQNIWKEDGGDRLMAEDITYSRTSDKKIWRSM